MAIYITDIANFIEMIYPSSLAEEWDNVGLLLGDRHREVHRIMTCLTITHETVQEAIERKTDLIVVHHPFPFHAGKRWTTDTSEGKMLLNLIGAGVAVISPHTAHDSALLGINAQLALAFGLQDVQPLHVSLLEPSSAMLTGVSTFTQEKLAAAGHSLGTGRIGKLCPSCSLHDFILLVQQVLCQQTIQWTGSSTQELKKIAIGCGAADSFVKEAATQGADALVVGEARFHAFLEARALGIALVVPGHFATERFAMENMAVRLAAVFPTLDIWAAEMEKDPLQYKHS